jgi:hypothetical protein
MSRKDAGIVRYGLFNYSGYVQSSISSGYTFAYGSRVTTLSSGINSGVQLGPGFFNKIRTVSGVSSCTLGSIAIPPEDSGYVQGRIIRLYNVGLSGGVGGQPIILGSNFSVNIGQTTLGVNGIAECIYGGADTGSWDTRVVSSGSTGLTWADLNHGTCNYPATTTSTTTPSSPPAAPPSPPSPPSPSPPSPTPPSPSPTPPSPSPTPCWVAREVYGETNPEWVVFRDWLFTEGPNWLQKTYIKYGQRFADFIRTKPILKSIVKFGMDKVVRNKNIDTIYAQSQVEDYLKNK